jgi:hypothetical protein
VKVGSGRPVGGDGGFNFVGVEGSGVCYVRFGFEIDVLGVEGGWVFLGFLWLW